MERQQQRSKHSAGVTGRPVDIRVVTTSDSHRPFELKWRMEGESHWEQRNVELPPEKKHHHLRFRIVDDGNLGLRFKATPEQSFGAHLSDDCPAPGSNGDGEIDFKKSRVMPNGELVIWDCNHKECNLTYALFFHAQKGDMKFDPIIKNSGGAPPTVDDG